MSEDNEKASGDRRERKERRKARFLPYLGKEKRSTKVIRAADVFEINIPALKDPQDRRNKIKPGAK